MTIIQALAAFETIAILCAVIAICASGISRAETSGGNRHARALVEKAYKKTGGPTSELKRVYGAYLDNERRRKEQLAMMNRETGGN